MIGQRVRLASGGPIMVVVDFDPIALTLTCAWPGGEMTAPIVCFDFIRQRHVI